MPFVRRVFGRGEITKAADPEWSRAQRATERFLAGISGAFLRLVESFTEVLSERKITEWITRGDVPGLLLEVSEIQWRAVDITKAIRPRGEVLPSVTRAASGSFEDVISGYYLDIIEAGAQREIKRLGFDIAFTLDNPYSLPWIREHTAELVRQVSESTKDAIRTIVDRSFTEHIPPKAAARQIRQIIGLTERQAVAVTNRRLALMAAGEDGGRLEKLVDAYAKRLLRQRSELIARTEIISAHAQGLQSSWMEARDAGFLNRSAMRVWIAATESDRTCDVCLSLDGTVVGLESEFSSEQAGNVFLPPAHPGCRCSVGVLAE